jgi:valyl-tRNA synthetase
MTSVIRWVSPLRNEKNAQFAPCQHLHGKFATHPFIPDRKIPIILDDQVEMGFGTGAVKVTPAHDPDDYRRGMEHKLEFINILNDDGTLNENVGPEFQGVKRFTARRKVIDRLKELGLYVGAKDNPMSIPVCSCVLSLSAHWSGGLILHAANPAT